MLPSAGWKPQWALEKALTFDLVSDVHLEVAEIEDVYWYHLYPFDSPYSSMAFMPDKEIIEQAKRHFKTVFTLTILTFPPDNQECRGG
jgi:hypothetical protein